MVVGYFVIDLSLNEFRCAITVFIIIDLPIENVDVHGPHAHEGPPAGTPRGVEMAGARRSDPSVHEVHRLLWL